MSGKRKRQCSFDDCPSTDILNVGLTFYSFPKDPVRRQKWIEISGCRSPAYNSCLCELHFDDIHISKTPRRNQLLSSAVPKAIRDNSYKITIPSIVPPPPKFPEDAQVEENDCFADNNCNPAEELVKRDINTVVHDESDYSHEEDGKIEEINDEETMEMEISEPIVISINGNSMWNDVTLVKRTKIQKTVTSCQQLGKNILNLNNTSIFCEYIFK